MNIFKNMKELRSKGKKPRDIPDDEVRKVAYRIAESDGFRRPPEEYWHAAKKTI